MRLQMKRLGKLASLLVVSVSANTFAVDAGFMDALASDARPQEDKMRDGARRPVQVMSLLGVDAGMTAVDVGAGGGWYTEVLSAAVGPSGTVVSQAGPRALQRNDGAAPKAKAARLGNVELSFESLDALTPNSADVAVTALSLHDQFNYRGEEGAIAFLTGIYDVLRSGGVAAIIDHEGDANMNNMDLHRIPAVEARRLIDLVGFEIIEESDLLHTAADNHTTSIRDPALGRNTDRFLFLVRKP